MCYVYILECNDKTLYTGWTVDIDNRLKVHNEGKASKYTRSRLPVKLVYLEKYNNKIEAQKREWQIKQFTRDKKLKLIEGDPSLCSGGGFMANFFEKVEANPIIAAVNDLERLDEALDSPCESIFLLTGNIFNLKEIAHRVKSKDKGLYINADLIDGFSKDTWGLEYIVKNIHPDGIITTKSNLIRMGKNLNTFTIQRLFILDSMSLEEGIESIYNIRPDAIEILPGVMPKIVKKIYEETKIPIITGGLIMDKEDVISSLNAGAIAVSTSNKKVWYI